MQPTPHPPPSGSRRGRQLFALLATLAVMLGAQPPPAAGAAAGPGAGTASLPATGATGATYPITLLTGDVVMLHQAPDGSQAAWLAEPATDRPTRPPQIYELDGQVHVVPTEAEPYLSSGALDQRLFNVTALARQGYDDASRADLPLLLAAPDSPAGSPDAAGSPELPAGAEQVRELDSIGAVSVTADKARMREFWESLRGPRPAAPGSPDARLAGAGTVWLNGQVETMLGDSVPHVGAPAAWAQGLDGSGTTVAVLDTGYDPEHPDLAGRVAVARNFTGDPDAIDGHGHGTHVAATVAGTGAASGGDRTGVAPGADLLVGKVLDSSGAGYDDWVIAGMEWAVAQDADVVSMSLGSAFPSDGSDPLSQAVDRLSETSGTLFVVAAGNSGPWEGSITSPGAATHALTVGAATTDDRAADFSSRGPRAGDGLIKPEIVAPGVDVVAARAAGTSLGNLLDEHYTTLSGTSMATPHVAGAAAILAQQHPDWDGEQLKSRLVATATPLAGEPVTFQGTGRLDVATAVAAAVTVDHASLTIGGVDADQQEPVTRTLTYRNATDRPVTLQLSVDVTGTGSDTDRKPVLTANPSALVVPAGGQASTEIRLRPDASRPGGYAGWIVATDARGVAPPVRTVLSATINGPMRTVTVTGTGRDGQPAGGIVHLWSAETGELSGRWMLGGVAEVSVPDGVYTLFVSLESGASWPPSSTTIASEPELTVRRDLDIHYDARDAEPVRVTTPRDALMDRFQVMWYREVGSRSISMIPTVGLPGQQLYTLPGQRHRTGTFEVSTIWQLAQPLLTARFTDVDGQARTATAGFATPGNPYVGDTSLPVVDAGKGTAEDYAGVDVAGKVALVTRTDNVWSQVQAAADAGAELLLVHNDTADPWFGEVWNAPVPAYAIDRPDGAALRQALAADPDLVLDVSGISDSTYSYRLAFTESGGVPDGRTYRPAEESLAVVESDYRQDSDRLRGREAWIPYPDSGGLGNTLGLSRNGPVVRTDYLTGEGVRWQRFAQPHEFLSVYWTWSPIQRYEAGAAYQQLWWGPLTRPGVPELTGAEAYGLPVARFRDAIRVVLLPYVYGDGPQYSSISDTFGDTVHLTMRGDDGEVIGTARWPEAQFTVPPERGWYELAMTVDNGYGNWMDTSVHTESTWRFSSARPDGEREVVPLVHLGYHLDAGPYNEVPAGAVHNLVIEPGYQPQADGPGGFTVTVEVSYDDGQSWTGAPVEAAAGAHTARIPAAPAGAGFAAVRVVATDAGGNQLTQLIERAWRID